MRTAFFLSLLVLSGALCPPLLGAAEPLVAVGVARIDITPELPIRLSGY